MSEFDSGFKATFGVVVALITVAILAFVVFPIVCVVACASGIAIAGG